MFVLFFRRPHSLATSSALRSLNSPSLEVQQIRCSCFWSSSSCNRNCQSVIALSIPGGKGARSELSARVPTQEGRRGPQLLPSLPQGAQQNATCASTPQATRTQVPSGCIFVNSHDSEIQGSPVIPVVTTHVPSGRGVASKVRERGINELPTCTMSPHSSESPLNTRVCSCSDSQVLCWSVSVSVICCEIWTP